ncbi:glycosyl hydrolase [Gordonia sp. Z-3]|uniref:glycoside hydrolase family 26 protein n=1 Tax=Gordonia sp. Z-3 TaxID=3115408 RepID=UPI002E28D19F|nr:glycosyl hydrolase [Gordonia sp. Z-3]MED5803087.1 glycosyl hydrolase [Gordonia sp. Z-3]
MRPPQPTPPTHLSRRSMLRATLAGTAALTVGACSSESTGASTQTRSWGAYIPSVVPAPSQESPISRLATLAEIHPTYIHRYAFIDEPAPITDFDIIAAAGATPLLTLEPGVADGGPNQPQYSLQRVANGAFDDTLQRWAFELTSWGKPLLVRFAPKMNTPWYPWSVGVNGNTPELYRAAWSRMRALFDMAGTATIKFLWAPYALTDQAGSFVEAYPDPSEVDYLGLDGYNWGDVPGHRWTLPSDLFDRSLEVITSLDGNHPVLFTEVACAAAWPGRKAAWIRDLRTVVAQHPRVEALLWYQAEDRDRDWRFNTTDDSIRAFRSMLAHLINRT